MTGVDALVERGLADNDRLAVCGWSYGGFMTSTIFTKTDRFKAAVVGAGVTETPKTSVATLESLMFAVSRSFKASSRVVLGISA